MLLLQLLLQRCSHSGLPHPDPLQRSQIHLCPYFNLFPLASSSASFHHHHRRALATSGKLCRSMPPPPCRDWHQADNTPQLNRASSEHEGTERNIYTDIYRRIHRDTGVAGAGDWLQEEGAHSDGTTSHGDATPGWPPLLAR